MANEDHPLDLSLGQRASLDANDGAPMDGKTSMDDINSSHVPPQYGGGPSSRTVFDETLHSDLGVTILLNRLKQSISSARDFAAFLKKRSSLEDEQAQGLRKLCRATHEGLRRPDGRQGSFAQGYNEIVHVQERMAEHGMQFSQSLHQMHDEIHDLAANTERGRKHWKQTGLTAEKRSQDAETLMEKAKLKYDSLAEDYDRARTGDRQPGRVFGLRGPRSAAQLEEDLQRKVQAADADYASKVQVAQSQRRELLADHRPQAVKALHDLIRECDAALTMQMQRFASLQEDFLLNNGMTVSPIVSTSSSSGDGPATSAKTLREVVSQIDNEKDLQDHVMAYASKASTKPAEIRYERHPTLVSHQQSPSAAVNIPASRGPQSSTSQLPPLPFSGSPSQGPPYSQHSSTTVGDHHSSPSQSQPPPTSQPFNHGSPGGAGAGGGGGGGGGGHAMDGGDYGRQGMPSHLPPPLSIGLPATQYGVIPQQQPAPSPADGSPSASNLAPLKPVFGLGLEELYRRDASAVPMIVYQCIQAVDLYGLEVEGIYRLSGTNSHVAKIKSIFDHDSTLVDFRNPEHFFHDVNSVAGALKQFFRDLPDPLLTREHYPAFIEAAHLDDDIVRRDSLHAVINSLPDPNYATLRALILHLHRVQEHSQVNRMNAGNIAICFGPTLMGSHNNQNISDAGWQVRVIDTILQNTYQIFDDD